VTGPAPADERRHAPPAGASPWSELYTWELNGDGAGPAATIRLVLHGDRAWYLAAVVSRDGPLTVVTDLEVPRPSSPTSLEVRTSGLWADHNIETPLSHVSIGLEAFGVALDDPVDALTDGFGVRTPVGFDLEWEDDRPPVAGLTPDRYEAPGRAHGEILLGTLAFEVDGPGSREHAWGLLGWASPGWWRASIRWADGRHSVARGPGPVAGPAPGAVSASGRAVTTTPDRAVSAPAGTGVAEPGPATIELWWDDWGLPVAARLDLGGPICDLEPEACIPVLLGVAPDGTCSTLRSTLVICRDPHGGRVVGRGWLEIVGPHPSPRS
jgi:hypothetical protein